MGYNRPLNYILYTHYNILYHLYFVKRASCVANNPTQPVFILWCRLNGKNPFFELQFENVVKCWSTKLRMNCKCWLKWPLFWSWTVFVLFKVGAVVWRILCRVVISLRQVGSCRDTHKHAWLAKTKQNTLQQNNCVPICPRQVCDSTSGGWQPSTHI